jgi:hypothetical protein
MDYTKMTNDPLFKVQKIVQSSILSIHEELYTVLTLRKHYVKLKDTWLQILNWWEVHTTFH